MNGIRTHLGFSPKTALLIDVGLCHRTRWSIIPKQRAHFVLSVSVLKTVLYTEMIKNLFTAIVKVLLMLYQITLNTRLNLVTVVKLHNSYTRRTESCKIHSH